MRPLPLLAAAGLLLTSLASQADPFSCRNGHFPASEGGFSQAQVAPGEAGRSHFFDDGEGCPQAEGCRRKSYLVEGDQVLVAQRDGAWSCVWYFGAKRDGSRRDFVGWMASADLRPLPRRQPDPEDWLGDWHADDNRLQISQGNEDALEVSGDAVWYGGINSYGDQVVHVGSLGGAGVPQGERLEIREGEDEYSCHVRLHLVGTALVVADNGNCGGLNVRFNGVYRR